jgi:glycosidase
MAKNTEKSLRKLFIYQIYVRNYQEEGTFNAVKKDLKRIKSLGVDIVYLLPIHPIGEKNRKGQLGSPYSIKDYYKVNPELGTLEDFKDLVEAVHNHDMKIMLDMVFNHTSYDSLLLDEHPEFFYQKNGEFTNKVGDWWDITDLDYFKDKALWTYLNQVVLYWSKLGVDGFRFDVASLLPIDFLSQLIEKVKRQKPDTIFLSESVHGGFCRYLRNQDIYCLSESEIYQVFDMAYDYDVHPYFEGYLKGENSFKRYLEALIMQEEIYPDNYVKVRNLENHDFGRFAKIVDNNQEKIIQWLALNFFSKGATMIYAGQEAMDDHLPDLFNKDTVHWDGPDLSREIKKFHALTASDLTAYGAYDIHLSDKDVYVGTYQYHQEKLVGIFNVGLDQGDLQVPLEDGTYINLFNQENINIKDGLMTLINQPVIIKY